MKGFEDVVDIFNNSFTLLKEKECQAREAEEVRQLDIELLHQRAIEAEEEQKREVRNFNLTLFYDALLVFERVTEFLSLV